MSTLVLLILLVVVSGATFGLGRFDRSADRGKIWQDGYDAGVRSTMATASKVVGEMAKTVQGSQQEQPAPRIRGHRIFGGSDEPTVRLSPWRELMHRRRNQA